VKTQGVVYSYPFEPLRGKAFPFVLLLKKKKESTRVPNGNIFSKGKQRCIEKIGGSMATPGHQGGSFFRKTKKYKGEDNGS
jgi:hypothetical protein